ncbi:MAG: copper resistance protein CopC [Thauera sp.]|jgi:copper transport protein|nr:copper resistance protein CopC [Thauera sp.]
MTQRLAAIALLCLILLPAGQAHAHAFLVETVPEDSTQLKAPPSHIVLRFNEPVSPARVELLSDQKTVLTGAGDWTVDGDTVQLTPPKALPAGVYHIAYRVTSADGHPVAGQIQFGIGVKPDEAKTVDISQGGVGPIAVLMRAIHYFAVLAGMGGGLFWTFVLACRKEQSTEALRQSLMWLVLLAAWSGVLLVGLNGAILDGAGLGSLLAVRSWSIGAGTTTATAATVVLLGGLFTLAGLLQQPSGLARVLLLSGALMAALSLAVTGHAGTASPRWLSLPLVFLHGLAAEFWVGALWPLTVLLRGDPNPQMLAMVRRFSRIAVVSVLVLLATGVGMSILQSVTSVAAITQTGYGLVWSAKMVVVLLLIGIAVWNRAVLTPVLENGARQASRRLRRNVLIEVALVAVVLTLTASFALTPPPRALPQFAASEPAAHEPPGYSAVVSSGGWTAVIDVLPARAGNNRIRIALTDTQGQPTTVRLVSEWRPTGETDAITVVHDEKMDGNVTLPAAGRWRVSLRWDGPDGTSSVMRLTVPITSGTSISLGAAG